MIATVTFNLCIQDSQEYGSDDEHMGSRVFFTMKVEGKEVEGLYVSIKQVAGGAFETDPIEVGSVAGTHYRGPFNYDAFRVEVEKYYRSLVGAQASGIRIQDSTNVRMRNNRFMVSKVVTFEVGGAEAAW